MALTSNDLNKKVEETKKVLSEKKTVKATKIDFKTKQVVEAPEYVIATDSFNRKYLKRVIK